MRMHEILGVEPGEVFGYKNACGDEVKYNLDAQGNVFRAVEDHKRVPSPREIVDIINHPELIIRKPRLSAEQIEHLKALNLLGFNYLFEANYGAHIASISKPVYARNAWVAKMCKIAELPKEWLFFSLLKENNGLVDIVQTLKDVGVER